jgi:mannose-6-phosphate isomerase-like protein (cupin superfamily)
MTKVLTRPEQAPDFAKSSEELHRRIEESAREGVPSFFRLKAQLPKRGRTNVPLAATKKMWIVLKTYAADGENELHAHPSEDHAFVILQGKGTFYGPNGEERTIGKNEGVMLPHGTYYWFKAVGDEPLVLLRIGCASQEGATSRGRINIEGKPMAGDSKENKTVTRVMTDKWFE